MRYPAMAKSLNLAIVSALILYLNGQADLPQTSSDNDNTQKLVFAFHTNLLNTADIKDVRSAIDYWVGEMGKEYNMTFEGHIYDDINQIIDGLKNGHIDIINFSLLEYFRNQRFLDFS